MYISKDFAVNISQTLLNAATKVAGTQNKLATQNGLNVITTYRITRLGLPASLRTFLTCISVIGIEESLKIIQNAFENAKASGQGSCEAYFRDYKDNRKLRDLRFNDEKNSKAIFNIADM